MSVTMWRDIIVGDAPPAFWEKAEAGAIVQGLDGLTWRVMEADRESGRVRLEWPAMPTGVDAG